MTTFDYAPLFRSTVGFDRLMNMLESTTQWAENANGYPPYNIEKLGDDRYRITVAVAGFAADELTVEAREHLLVVDGRKKETDSDRAFLYRGIATRSFKRQFQLADYVRVTDAHLLDGLLIIDLVRELPEAMKPRKIEISTAAPAVGDASTAKLVGSGSLQAA